jgi:RNA polymerase sigma-70 factor (ECF subfamily)
MVGWEVAEVPPVTSPSVDELTRLFLAARDGDRSALLQAIRASQADVWRLASHLVGRDDADDVSQDAFVRAWRALPAYRGDASARTWLLAIARRACADHVRSQVRRRRLAGLAGMRDRGTPSRALAADPAGATTVQALVDALPDDRRSAFVLTQVLGCSYDEAAAVCGVPVGTIRSRVARAREQLAAALRASDSDGTADEETG